MGATPYSDSRLYSRFYRLSRSGSWPYASDLAVRLRRLRQSIKAKRAINLLGFTSDAEAPVADEMGKANEHVVSLWQERWDTGKRGRMTYRFLPSVSFASTNRWFRPGFLTVFILTRRRIRVSSSFPRHTVATDSLWANLVLRKPRY